MSAVMFENYSPGRLDGWSTSLILHGVLGGLILLAIMGSEKPLLPEPFRWEVAFLSAAPAPPMAQPAAAPVAQVQPVVQATPPAVTEAVAPAQQPAVVSAAPVMEQAEPSEPEALPPPAVVDTGRLADLLWRRMEALKRYPYLARRNGWEGQVLIKAVIGADGHLLHAEIVESSGHETLDQDALKVLRASTPLKLEQNPSWQQATLTIPVAYRLQR